MSKDLGEDFVFFLDQLKCEISHMTKLWFDPNNPCSTDIVHFTKKQVRAEDDLNFDYRSGGLYIYGNTYDKEDRCHVYRLLCSTFAYHNLMKTFKKIYGTYEFCPDEINLELLEKNENGTNWRLRVGIYVKYEYDEKELKAKREIAYQLADYANLDFYESSVNNTYVGVETFLTIPI